MTSRSLHVTFRDVDSAEDRESLRFDDEARPLLEDRVMSLSPSGPAPGSLRAAAIALMVLSAGCSARPKTPPQSTVYVRVVDEDKSPIAGARVMASDVVLGETDAEGRAPVIVYGREGAAMEVEVRCPDAFRSPNAPVLVRRFSDRDAAEYTMRCLRKRHSVVVHVHAENGGDLPILHLGKEIGHTDPNGIATVRLEGEVAERFEIVLSTAAPQHAKLHPQNPAAVFDIGAKDDEQTLDIKLSREKKAAVKVVARRAPKAF